MMVNLWASLLTCVTVVAAVSDHVPAESDVQRVVSHLESLMPLHLASGKRLRRQAPTENGTSGEQPTTPPSLYVHFKYKKCCKKMPNLIDKKPVKKCLKALRPTRPPPPPGGPGGSPPPPPGGPGGPPPPGGPDRPPPPPMGPGGPPPPPPPPSDIPGLLEDEDAEASDDIDSQNSGPSGQMHNGQDRIGAKSWKGGKHGRFRETVACAVECAFQNESLIKDGAVDQDAYKAYLEKYIQEKNASIWKDAIDAALQNCSLSLSTYINQEQKCKSGAMEMLECMERQIFVNCPESNWKDKDEKCDACRTSLENCGHKRGHHKWHKARNETEEVPN